MLLERLDQLKDQTCELTVTLEDDTAALPELEAEVLWERRKLRQWQVLARNTTEEQRAALRSHPSVHAVEVRPPSLEEIFVAYMQLGPERGEAGAAGEVQAQ